MHFSENRKNSFVHAIFFKKKRERGQSGVGKLLFHYNAHLYK